MAYAKPIYGPEFEQLLMTAFNQTPFRLKLETPGKAKLFRMKVYGYFNVLRKEDLRLDLIEMADNLQVRVEDCEVVFNLKDMAWELEAIRQQLGLSEGFAETGINQSTGELQVPDLMGTRLKRKLDHLRERKAAQTVVTPLKT